ncbi:2-isopropylmalate synthase [Natronospirillum operosum]|uniref:2-isopropylmalate synthase n=1 Tax=Natronospirillum operosum TaxID=2759953 RepID=A0A4Z0W5L1_9GAMM|nr:2-isopropylmalate synthase [Natronospirillum operosum]TGG92380.1 2-isopropylmalate synthase [Natronospirillum operosum]
MSGIEQNDGIRTEIIGDGSAGTFDYRKYPAYPKPKLSDRTWPDQEITRAPVWASVDLRDGNQALIEPMTVQQKMVFFELLVDIGFKEIEIGFPAASQIDYDFTRRLIEEDLIPQDVTVQVLVQAREELIERTYESLQGVHRAIVHVYNSTSTVQRRDVFRMDQAGIRDLAVQGATWVQEYAKRYPDTDWRFQYSPESFTGTELDYAIDVCNAVLEVWQPRPENPVIINLPATVEMTTPNVFADQIEIVHRQLHHRDAVVLSVHTHNDRGTGIAASELAVMAGADRVEGTLLGNGERTGNMDILTMAMNLYSRGVDPELDLADMARIQKVYEYCNQLPVHPRHPYIGELVYTSFSGSHQDAIRKCMSARKPGDLWDVAYIPIDPTDLGRNYEAVIRVNSQSGKGGVAWLLERETGYNLPRELQPLFSQHVQKEAERTAKEVRADWIVTAFEQEYMARTPLRLGDYRLSSTEAGDDQLSADVHMDGQQQRWVGKGDGPVDAWTSALAQHVGFVVEVDDYAEHTLGTGSDARAVAYVKLKTGERTWWGVGTGGDIARAALDAVSAAVNRELAARAAEAQVA